VTAGARINTRSLGKKTFKVEASDKAGNASTASTRYTVLPRLPPAVKVSFNFQRSRTSTTFTELSLKGVPKRSKVTARCLPPRRGAACPAKALNKRRARGTIKLKSFVGKRFTPGTVIDIRVTKRGSIGAVKLVTIHANANPSIATRCLPPGKKKPRKRC
jgi:hypothetical protein